MKPFRGINHGKDDIDLTHLDYPPVEFKPIEIHLKENGSITDEPSIAIVMQRPEGFAVVGQLSIKMWNEGLADIGYEIVKKK